MKRVVVFLLLVVFAFAAKAQSLQPNNDYKQKRRFNSLQKNYKRETITINRVSQLVYNMPATPLSNEGEKVGMAGQDTIYKMKTDKMLLLKPNRITTKIPKAAGGK